MARKRFTPEQIVAILREAERGMERKCALRLAGDALQNGYSAKEMHQLRWMVMTAHMHGGPQDEVLVTLEDGIRNQKQLKQMVHQMWQHGWMGPGDEHSGKGVHGPGDGSSGHGPGDQGSGQDKQGGQNGGNGGGN